MPVWWVSEPLLNLRIEDEPLGYQPSRGNRVAFRISYRQRGYPSIASTYATTPLPPEIFGLGPNWSCSWRFFVHYDLNYGVATVVRPGSGGLRYGNDTLFWQDHNQLNEVWTSGTLVAFTFDYPTGARATFGKRSSLSDGNDYYFITSFSDPAGRVTTYTYDTQPSVVRLVSLTDPDSRVTHLYYDNSALSNQVTRVVDPFNRTTTLQYNSDVNSSFFGALTNLTDVASLPTSFSYQVGTNASGTALTSLWITNMTTPYGPTGFRYGGIDAGENTSYQYGNQVNRFVEISQPNGGKQLFLARDVCTQLSPSDPTPFLPDSYAGSQVPNTTNANFSIANTLDNVDQANRNSFHWGPLQYAQLSSSYRSSGDVGNLTLADYKIARLRHWLILYNGFLSCALSLERAPSPDGSADGQITWYDYDGKPVPFGNNIKGTNNLPSLVARVLPDGTTQFTRYIRNQWELPTQEISTYTRPDGQVDVRTNTLIYAANGIDLVQQIGPNHEQVVSNYFNNTLHQPDASYDALNQETLYTYSANRQLTSVKNPSQLTTTNVYFSSGTYADWLDRTIDLEIKRTNAYAYTNGLVLTHTDERGLTTTNYWDDLQRLTRIDYPNGSVSNIYTYLDLTKTKDRMNNWTYFGYNAIRQKIAETNANNVVSRYGYCDCGSLLSVTNGWNTPVPQVTSFGYDYQGNRIYVTDADSNTTTNWFDSLGRVVQTGDYWGTNGFNYNNQGLLITNRNAFGVAQSTVYDIEDRPVYVTDANNVTVTNTYDSLGRLRTRGYPDGGVEKFGYSARGLIAYTNQIGLSNFFAYDEGRRKTFETNGNNELIRYTNNAAGDLLALTDGKVQTTRWNYDEFGRLTNKLDQAGVEILRYKYDADDRLTNRWSKAKGDTVYGYDAVGNLTSVNYPSSPDITRQYDWLNRVTNMVDAAGTTKYTYTMAGRLLTEDGPFTSDTVTNVYTGGLRTGLGLQQPTGVWTNLFAYDAAKRLTSVTSPAGTFSYQLAAGVPSRLPIKITLPNTSYITNIYDNVVRLTATYLKNSGNTTLDSYAYVYDPANERTNLTRADASTVAYKYDNIGQLKVADSSVNAEDWGYLYDAAWNLNKLTNNGVVNTFIVDNKNQLTNVYGNLCRYDSNGNLTNHASYPFCFYDDENQLVQASDETYGSYRSNFAYDGLGRLRQRLDYYWQVDNNQGPGEAPPQPGHWALTNTVLYIYDGMRVIQERDGSSTPTVSYTRGNDLSGSLEGAGGIGGLLARSHGYSSGDWTNHNVYFADGNGNITYMLNSSQSMVASYRYEPFGETISQSGTLADANRYRFSSKEIHSYSGMYYYGYRFYFPHVQRWINRDPIGEYGAMNLYAFAVNCPIDWVDVEGLSGVALAPAPGVARPANPIRFGPRIPPILGPVSLAVGVGMTGVLLIDSCYPPASPDPLPIPTGPPVVTYPGMPGGNPIPVNVTGPSTTCYNYTCRFGDPKKHPNYPKWKKCQDDAHKHYDRGFDRCDKLTEPAERTKCFDEIQEQLREDLKECRENFPLNP